MKGRPSRALTLRSRLTLLTALAVAVAVAASAFACWFITKESLTSELDKSLRENRPPDNMVAEFVNSGRCTPEPQQEQRERLNLVGTTLQVVDAQGNSCIIEGQRKVDVSPSDTAVAVDGGSVSHDGTATDGTRMRVFSTQLRGNSVAVTVARPLDEIDSTLNTLALVLLAVAGVGVVGATAAGLWIARTGLKPVDRLTSAVEHVARTEDLTVRIPAEGKDEIARLGSSFNAMTTALASSRDRQAQLIADAGHELRTPLTSLRTNIELLSRSDDTGRAIPPDDRRALMAGLKAQMTELAALIGDLQELSRPDAAPALEVVELHTITESALKRARLRGPDLTITSGLFPWYVQAEPSALERAIVNLLDNAVKFSPPGGEVEVLLRGGELTVRDQGPGIPADELPHVFERFWRSPSARSLPGSGLGLSIVARTVQHSGGQVSLRPAPGGGTLAVVRLPGTPAGPPEPDRGR